MDHLNNTSNGQLSDSRLFGLFAFFVGLVVSFAMMLLVGGVAHAAGPGVQQVSTGTSTACAVSNFKAYCWGSNANGLLGTGRNVANNISNVPLAVSASGAIPADPGVCSLNILGRCLRYSSEPVPAQPASALQGKDVTKVVVGATHACALADADIYCWGNNTYGQLGNRSNVNSLVPVIVDKGAAFNQITPAHCAGTTLPFIGCVGGMVAQTSVTVPGSALRFKEISDIAVGDNFTCALASDGTVACWGLGTNGRLGTNSTSNANFPQSVYAASGTALFGKKGIKLANASGAAMCVIANSGATTASAATPYCWGLGMGTGAIPAARTKACGKSSGNLGSSGVVQTNTVYFDSSKPVDSTGVVGLMQSIDVASSSRATGIGNDNKAYYWGLNGYVQTMRSGTPKCTWTTTSSSGGNVTSSGHPCGGGGGGGSGTPGCGGGGTTVVHHTNYTQYYTYAPTGSTTAKGPLYNDSSAGLLGQKSLTLASGNGYNGLFCAKTTSAGSYCDDHGTGMTSGQTGSNYTQSCTTTSTSFYGIVTGSTTTCAPAPTGPQQVYDGGWLSGKNITQLSTSGSGFSCAIANGQVGCWGVNSSGQLGDGSTTNKNVPTKVNL